MAQLQPTYFPSTPANFQPQHHQQQFYQQRPSQVQLREQPQMDHRFESGATYPIGSSFGPTTNQNQGHFGPSTPPSSQLSLPQGLRRSTSTSSHGSHHSHSPSSPASSSASASALPERRTRRRRSFRGAATKLARRKFGGTKVATIPEDPSAAGASTTSSESRIVTARNYQFRAFSQAETVPTGGEYSSYVPSAPAPPPPSNDNGYTFAQANGAPPAQPAPPPVQPTSRRRQALETLGAIGKRAVREVLRGYGNNPPDMDLKVTYYGRGGAGTRKTGLLPTIRSDSFGMRKGAPQDAPEFDSTRPPSAAYTSTNTASSYAPSVESAPQTSQSYARSSPITSYRSLSPNMFGGSRLSLSSYAETLSTSVYDEEAPLSWQHNPYGHGQEMMPRLLSGEAVGGYCRPHIELNEEMEEMDASKSFGANVNVSDVSLQDGTSMYGSQEGYMPDNQGYATYAPPVDQNALYPPSIQSSFHDRRSSSTPSSTSMSPSAFTSTDTNPHPSPASTSLPYTPVSTGTDVRVPQQPIPVSGSFANEAAMQNQTQALSAYLQTLSNAAAANLQNAGGYANPNPGLDMNAALQMQAMYAALAGGSLPQLLAQQLQSITQGNGGMAAGPSTGVLGAPDLASTLAQLTLLTAPALHQASSMSSLGEHSPSQHIASVSLRPTPTQNYSAASSAMHLPSLPNGVVQGGSVNQSQSDLASYQSSQALQSLSETEIEIAQTLARKQELEQRLLELEAQRMQRERALTPNPHSASALMASPYNGGIMNIMESQRYYPD